MKNPTIISKPPLSEFIVQPNLTDYDALYSSPGWSWDRVARDLSWFDSDYINKAHNCIDRHCDGPRRTKTALIWEAKDGHTERYSFDDLRRLTNRFAHVLARLGVRKGDRVFVFLDRIPELYITVFGTLKIGAVIGPLFSAFGPDAIRDRLQDSGATVIVTSPPLKSRLYEVKGELPDLKHVIVTARRYGAQAAPGELDFDAEMAASSDEFTVERTHRDDFSVMHYTSGTTGKPKGAVHVHNAIVSQYATAKYILDLQEDDIYWCTADPGWVTGTSYGMLGPWSNGITSVVYEGGFGADAWYGVIQKHRVTVWYTAPTAIRMLMKAGDDVPKRYDLTSLRYCCSVGEPLNPEAIFWGQQALDFVFHDNWWQTETGCILIGNYPILPVRAGSMGKPMPGIVAGIVDEDGTELPPGTEGHLAIRPGWPSMFRTYWNKQDLYDSRFRHGWYYTADRAWRDADGYFWFVGRADDVINTAGHLVGPFEVESALIEHPAVAEAGVIGKPDPERMEIIKAFISLKDGFAPSETLKEEIKEFVRIRLAAHAYPREIDFLASLPKTRSGKIMRRLLKARELGLPEGDTSTLED